MLISLLPPHEKTKTHRMERAVSRDGCSRVSGRRDRISHYTRAYITKKRNPFPQIERFYCQKYFHDARPWSLSAKDKLKNVLWQLPLYRRNKWYLHVKRDVGIYIYFFMRNKCKHYRFGQDETRWKYRHIRATVAASLFTAHKRWTAD